MRYSFFSRVITLSVFLASGILKADGIVINDKLSLGGYSHWQFGQIVKGEDGTGPFEHQWTNSALLGFTVYARPSDRLQLVLSPEFKLNYSFPESPGRPETVRPFGVAYINQADGIFSLIGSPEKPILELGCGVFTYKYNPDVRHLGEFLFRTGTYPMYIVTDFDFAKARLIGMRLMSEPVSNLHADILLTSEAFLYPLYDFSLTGIASYKLFNAIEVGCGVDFARLFSVDSKKTSPEISKYKSSVGCNAYIAQNGDTSYYSFKATKIMARASIDCKEFFGSPTFFGKEDLKLYGEIMWEDPFGRYNARDLRDSTGLDTTGFPAIYNHPGRRMPLMFGFNVPTFKGLDVLSAEFEYFPSMLPNDYNSVVNQFSPIPYIAGDGIGKYNPDNYKVGSWRWAFYAKRTVVKGFSVTGLIAFDHLRTTYWNGATQFFSSMTKPGHWHWDLKLGYSF